MPGAIAILGWFAFIVQLLVVSGFVLLKTGGGPNFGPGPNLDPPPNPASDWTFLDAVLAVWLSPLVLGSGLLRAVVAQRRTWLAHFLFCVLFFGVANGLSWLLLHHLHLHWLDNVLNWFFSSFRIRWQFVLALMIWSFPLGAVLAELAFRSLRRALKTNSTGSLA